MILAKMNITAESAGEGFKPTVKSIGQSNTRNGSAVANLSVISWSYKRYGTVNSRYVSPRALGWLKRKIANTFNILVASNQQMAPELRRWATCGHPRTRELTKLHKSKGASGELNISINTLVEDMLRPTAEATRAIAGVAQGNLKKKILRLNMNGRLLQSEFLRSAKIAGTMIPQLGAFAALA
jgi:hypothetical protein